MTVTFDKVLYGTEGNDVMDGLQGNDTRYGGTGNDALYGGAGNDEYVFNLGDSQKWIYNYIGQGTDTIRFGSGITLANLRLESEQVGGNSNHGYVNFVLKVGDKGDRIAWSDWYYCIVL